MAFTNGKSLLLIEKEESIRRRIREKCNEYGHLEIREIASSDELPATEEEFCQLSPDIVVLDIFFPGLNPEDFLKQVQLTLPEGGRVIILSHARDKRRIEAALQAGADFFIDKEHIDYSLDGILDVIFANKIVTKRLKVKEEEISSILETQQEMICRFTPDTTLTYINKAYADMFGTTQEALKGTRFLDFIPGEEHARIKRFLQSFGPENPTKSYRHKVELPDGSVGWQEWTDYAFFDDQGNITGFQSVGRDVSKEVRLSEALEKSEEKERRLIANDLHDHIGQKLTYAKLRIEDALGLPQGDEKEQMCGDVLDLIRESIKEVRLVSHRLVAGFKEGEDFESSLNELAKSFERMSKVRVNFCTDHIPKTLTREAKANLYHIIQEAFTNIMKHAEASKVNMSLFLRGNTLHLHIRDDGKGADLSQPMMKSGFLTMKYRVNQLDGDIRFHSTPGKFFEIKIKLPAGEVLHRDA